VKRVTLKSNDAAQRHPVNPVSQVAQQAAPPGAETAPRDGAPSIRVAQAPQTSPAGPNAPAPNAAAQAKPAPSTTAIPACDKPGGMRLARIVEIDTTGGPGFGFEHFKQYDFNVAGLGGTEEDLGPSISSPPLTLASPVIHQRCFRPSHVFALVIFTPSACRRPHIGAGHFLLPSLVWKAGRVADKSRARPHRGLGKGALNHAQAFHPRHSRVRPGVNRGRHSRHQRADF
jgi:hypothetical protein